MLARLCNFLDLWVARLTGVHINRRTRENIQEAGLVVIDESNLLATIFKPFEVEGS